MEGEEIQAFARMWDSLKIEDYARKKDKVIHQKLNYREKRNSTWH